MRTELLELLIDELELSTLFRKIQLEHLSLERKEKLRALRRELSEAESGR